MMTLNNQKESFFKASTFWPRILDFITPIFDNLSHIGIQLLHINLIDFASKNDVLLTLLIQKCDEVH